MSELLRLHLQFFAEGGEGGEGSEDSGTADKGGSDDTSWIDDLYSGDDESKDTTKDEGMIPKSRFDTVNSKYKELSISSQKTAGDYEALKTTHGEAEAALKVSGERVTALEGVIKSLVDAQLEQIDESYHDLIPQDKTIEQQLDWIVKAQAKGMFGMGKGSYEIEIGGMTNPGSGRKGGRSTEGANPLQLLTMGYGK
jgi:ribonucleoside-triphosphate reductase